MNSTNRFAVDPDELRNDLDHSLGLPASYYTDPAIQELDLKAIYRRNWQYVGPAASVSQKGDVMVAVAGDVPVVVTRAEDGELHAFVNVCRHRGYRVAEENRSKCRALVCKYHAWSYRLNGSLASAPGGNEDISFDKEKLGLLPLAVDRWGDAILVNVDAQSPRFTDSYPGIEEDAKAIGLVLEPGRYRFHRESIHDVPSNWKMWYDNFVECYHCDNIHSGSFSAAYDSDIKTVVTKFRNRYMFNQFAPKSSKSTTELRANNYRSFNIFPGFLYLQQDDLMILSQMRPTGPETTRQTVHYFSENGAGIERVEKWIELWEQTFTEDGNATAIQQEGLRTGIMDRNRLLPPREQAVVFFNRNTVDAYGRYLDPTPTAAAAE